jgi:hypothetical protein
MSATKPVILSFMPPGLVSLVARALEIHDRNEHGASVLVERLHIEAAELYPILKQAIHMIPSGAASHIEEHKRPLPEAAIQSVGVPLEEKVAFLRKFLSFLSALPETVTMIIVDNGEEIELRAQMEGGDQLVEKSARFPRSEAPFFARDILRRRRPMGSSSADGSVQCPMCFSVVKPHKGKMWGLWCPTCGVRLVLE